MCQVFSRLIGNDEGQDLIEYGLLVAAIALVCVVVLNAFGQSVSQAIGNADTELRATGGVP